jgi:2-hydroxy-4-carboxymuconate semialdehyde hemiacetal dehydrogenase
MPAPDPKTGIPMEVFIGVETEKDQSLVCNGSYYSRENMWDAVIITDRDTYRIDINQNKLTTSEGEQAMELEPENCALVTRDFIQAVKEGRPPWVTGESVLPAMKVLQTAQDNWDKKHGTQILPGRPLKTE